MVEDQLRMTAMPHPEDLFLAALLKEKALF